MSEPMRCHNCRVLVADAYPQLWFPMREVHIPSQMLVIMTHSKCCGKLGHTEPVAAVSSYLRPVKENAKMVCDLINAKLLDGKPQPQWLTDAWARWEEQFAAPERRKATA